METNQPRVSIVIPTYGRAEYLKNLLESLRSSTPRDAYEVTIVSSDLPDSEKVTWIKEQPDVTLVLKDVRGPKDKRKKSLYYYTNLGIKAGSYEWVFVVNDDMVFDPAWYKEFADLISKPENKNAGMVIVSTHIGDVALGSRIAKIGKIKKPGKDWTDLYLCDMSIIRRDVLEKIGYFDDKMDWFGSGADNSIALEMLTDTDTILGHKIKIEHFISEERPAVPGNAFRDFNYITNKWKKWCKQNGGEVDIDFGVPAYTLTNRFKDRLNVYKSKLKKALKR